MADIEASTSAAAPSEYYVVDEEKITINKSDGDPSKWPETYSREIGSGMVDILKPAEPKTVKEWKQKIGSLLAQELGVVDKCAQFFSSLYFCSL